MAKARRFGPPAGLDDGGGVGLGDDRGAVYCIAGHEGLAGVHRSLVGDACGMHADHVDGFQGRHSWHRLQLGLVDRLGGALGLHGDRLDDIAAARHDETEAPFVRVFEGRSHARPSIEGDDQRRVGAFVAQMCLAQHRDAVAANSLASDFGTRLGFQDFQVAC